MRCDATGPTSVAAGPPRVLPSRNSRVQPATTKVAVMDLSKPTIVGHRQRCQTSAGSNKKSPNSRFDAATKREGFPIVAETKLLDKLYDRPATRHFLVYHDADHGKMDTIQFGPRL